MRSTSIAILSLSASVLTEISGSPWRTMSSRAATSVNGARAASTLGGVSTFATGPDARFALATLSLGAGGATTAVDVAATGTLSRWLSHHATPPASAIPARTATTATRLPVPLAIGAGAPDRSPGNAVVAATGGRSSTVASDDSPPIDG